MSARRVPQALYDEVLALTDAIAQPDKRDDADIDTAEARLALAKLVALFKRRQAAGTADPFLTEALADFTEDDAESARLYRLALQQCSDFPDEPTHSKRQGLIERLLELGRDDEAGEELNRAMREAFAAGDKDAIKELDALVQQRAH